MQLSWRLVGGKFYDLYGTYTAVGRVGVTVGAFFRRCTFTDQGKATAKRSSGHLENFQVTNNCADFSIRIVAVRRDPYSHQDPRLLSECSDKICGQVDAL